MRVVNLGRGSSFRLAKIARRILTFRLDHPDLTRAEEVEAIGQERGIWLDQSAHRRAMDTTLPTLELYDPDLFIDLAWKTREKWQQYEAKYGIPRCRRQRVSCAWTVKTAASGAKSLTPRGFRRRRPAIDS